MKGLNDEDMQQHFEEIKNYLVQESNASLYNNHLRPFHTGYEQVKTYLERTLKSELKDTISVECIQDVLADYLYSQYGGSFKQEENDMDYNLGRAVRVTNSLIEKMRKEEEKFL